MNFLGAVKSKKSEASVEELEEQFNKLNQERDNLLNQINEKKAEAEAKAKGKALDVDSDTVMKDADGNQLISDEVIINFVDELDEVDRYFDLKQHLRDTCDITELPNARQDMLQTLFDRVKAHNIFNICDIDIEFAVEAYLDEALSPGIREQFETIAAEEKQWKLIELYGNIAEYTEEQRNTVDRMLPGLIYTERETWDVYALSSPLWRLAIQTREKGIEMDEDIRVELQKIKEADPLFYHMHFVCGKMPVDLPRHTVTAFNIPRDVTRFDVETALSAFGKIVHVEIESGKRKSTLVHVTFRTKREADRALSKPLEIEGKRIELTTPERAPEHLKLTDVRTASQTKEAARKALLTYTKLREKYKKMSSNEEDVSNAVNKASEGGGIPDKQQLIGLEVSSVEGAGTSAEGVADKKQKRNPNPKTRGASKAGAKKSTRRRL